MDFNLKGFQFRILETNFDKNNKKKSKTELYLTHTYLIFI